MKAKRVDNARVFDPVTIELTFETLAEIEQFWHRMNLGAVAMTSAVKNGYHNTTPTGEELHDSSGYVDFAEIWYVAEDFLQELANR